MPIVDRKNALASINGKHMRRFRDKFPELRFGDPEQIKALRAWRAELAPFLEDGPEKKFRVEIEERSSYEIDIKAANEEEAEAIASRNMGTDDEIIDVYEVDE